MDIQMEDIKVSIICNVYNHGPYIGACLEGFVSQNTDFIYEVLVHDDASSDNSADIIREYADKYPNLIKPIYQKENQYSKGISIGKTYQYSRAKGKYIAFCEGDDYWIDPLKLQKQYDYMESHPNCTICFTNGYIENQQDNQKRRIFIPYNNKDSLFYEDKNKEYTLENAFELTFLPTASLFFRLDTYLYVSKAFVGTCPTADLRMRLYLTSQGYSYYMCDKTCVYRENVPNSAMSRWKKYSKQQLQKHNIEVIKMLSNLDAYTCEQYSSAIEKIKRDFIVGRLMSASSVSILKDYECKKVFDAFNIRQKMKFFTKLYAPETLIDIFRQFKTRKKRV